MIFEHERDLCDIGINVIKTLQIDLVQAVGKAAETTSNQLFVASFMSFTIT
jgi:hypothetical protein